MLSHKERENDWITMRESVKQAKSILCIGAGPTGVQSASYIKENYPNKQVGIALRGNTILARLHNAHPLAEQILKTIGVSVHTGVNYKEGTLVNILDF
jgi:NADH dehydrogenase FAD-containing subunit